MASNSKNIAELLNTDSTIATADIADGAINNAKVATNAAIVTSKISGLTAAIDGGLGRLENEVGLLNVNRLVDNSAVIDDFVKGFSDAFIDETGVNTGSNSNLLYNYFKDKPLSHKRNVNCNYNKHFKKWTPINFTNENKIDDYFDIKEFLNKI